MLVYFGYTFCPDVCPTTLNEVADALDRLGGKADRLQPIFITVDPKRDTPAVVKQYVAAFTPRLIGLTGSDEQIAKVAQEYRVYYAEHRTGPGPNDYTMDHSSVLYLMGPDGKFIAPIRADEDGAQMAADLDQADVLTRSAIDECHASLGAARSVACRADRGTGAAGWHTRRERMVARGDAGGNRCRVPDDHRQWGAGPAHVDRRAGGGEGRTA